MPLEPNVQKIADLNEAWPIGSADPKSEGDDHLRNIKRAVRSLLSDVAQIGFGLVDLTLTQATTAVNYTGPVVPGALVTVILRQDSTGGREISWASKFKGVSPVIDKRPGFASVFQFVGLSNGDLALCAQPLLGLSL